MPSDKPEVGSYRIRWANVRRSNGRSFSRVRMCIAERRFRWFGWWPVIDADWCFDEAEAKRDIEHDRDLRRPIPAPTTVR